MQAEAAAPSPPEPVPQPELRSQASQGEVSHLPRVQPHVRPQGQPDPPPCGPRPRVGPPGEGAGPQDRSPDQGQVHRRRDHEGKSK